MAKEPNKKKEAVVARWLYLACMVTALVGVALAVELLRVHSQVHQPGSAPPTCDISEGVSCTPVALHEWSEFWGVPTAAWGLLFYATVLLWSWAGWRRRPFPRGPGGLILASALPAVGFGLFLVYVMTVEIQSFCLYCLGLDAVNLGLLGWGWALTRGRRRWLAWREDLVLLWRNKPAGLVFLGLPLVAAMAMIATYPAPPPPAAAGGNDELPTEPLATVREADIDVAGGPVWGPGQGMITIYEFSDYQCPFCRAAHEEIREAVQAHEDRTTFVHFHHPLDMACNPAINRPFHPQACLAAKAAICAHEQGRFWPFNDLLFEHGRRLDGALLERLLGEAGIDREAFDECQQSDRPAQRIAHDLAQAAKVPVQGTPTFVINGRVLSGYREGLYRSVLTALIEHEGSWSFLERRADR
jgi:protein-disulfide isomerase/uncharacterized membrane protein